MASILQVLLQVSIVLTGNYNFFNLLTMVLCIPLLVSDTEIWLNNTDIANIKPGRTNSDCDGIGLLPYLFNIASKFRFALEKILPVSLSKLQLHFSIILLAYISALMFKTNQSIGLLQIKHNEYPL